MATAYDDAHRREMMRLQRRRFRERYHQGHPSGIVAVNVTVPDDVVVLTEHGPCTFCGQARGSCRHRPWLEGASL